MDSAQRPPLIPMRPMKLPMKVSLVAALALWLVLVALNQPLHTAAAPQGIVSLQLAGTAEQTHAILRSWRDGWRHLRFLMLYSPRWLFMYPGFVLMAIIIAHIYIGSIGMEGAFDAMGEGHVEEQWAAEHHSLWYEKKRREGEVAPKGATPAE